MYDGFISQLINVLNSNFRNSRGGRLLLGGYPKGYKKAEHISTKVEIKPWMLLTFKNKNAFEALTQGNIWDINFGTPDNFSSFRKEKDRGGLYQVR